jgi:hypothetical protein
MIGRWIREKHLSSWWTGLTRTGTRSRSAWARCRPGRASTRPAGGSAGRPGTYPVSFTATDGTQAASADITITVNAVTVQGQLDSLTAQVAGLAIPTAQRNTLTVALTRARAAFRGGDKDAALQAVDGFAGQVRGLTDNGVLVADQAADLIASADAINAHIVF